jgi:hypothetical protein
MTEHLANTSGSIPARIKASQVSGNTFECKLGDGAECFSGRVEMSNFGACKLLPHGTLRSGFE